MVEATIESRFLKSLTKIKQKILNLPNWDIIT